EPDDVLVEPHTPIDIGDPENEVLQPLETEPLTHDSALPSPLCSSLTRRSASARTSTRTLRILDADGDGRAGDDRVRVGHAEPAFEGAEGSLAVRQLPPDRFDVDRRG